MRTVLFAGGGSLGPVTPLLAVAARMHEQRPDLRMKWIGTDHGPERALVESAGIPFASLVEAKLPRYLSWKMFTAPFDYLRARRDASRLLDEAAPSLVLSAGGFTATPVILEAAGRHLPCIAHQLDYQPGLSNRMAARYCRYVTTSFDYPQGPFGARVVTYRVPTPTRFSPSDLPSRDAACRFFGFDPARPVILVTGGGTGAKTLNEAFYALRNQLPADVQILHLTGRGKSEGIIAESPTYVVNEFLNEEMLTAYAAADVVVSRAGVGAISEIAALRKAAVFVPLPDSPQETNVRALRGSIRSVWQQHPGFQELLKDAITELVADTDARVRLGEGLSEAFPTDRGEMLASIALSVLV